MEIKSGTNGKRIIFYTSFWSTIKPQRKFCLEIRRPIQLGKWMNAIESPANLLRHFRNRIPGCLQFIRQRLCRLHLMYIGRIYIWINIPNFFFLVCNKRKLPNRYYWPVVGPTKTTHRLLNRPGLTFAANINIKPAAYFSAKFDSAISRNKNKK